MLLVDNALDMDFGSWLVALDLGKQAKVSLVLASRRLVAFVLIDVSSRDSFLAFKRLPNVLKLNVPLLPRRAVEFLARDTLLCPEQPLDPFILVALERCQGNPLFIKEMLLEMDTLLEASRKKGSCWFSSKTRPPKEDSANFPMCQLQEDLHPPRASNIANYAVAWFAIRAQWAG